MKELYKIAAAAATRVYERCTDLGTTEYDLSLQFWNGHWVQVLAFAGTNEFKDWFSNLRLFSRKGIKTSALNAAIEVHKVIQPKLHIGLQLIVTGHSKGAAEAIAYAKMYRADYCIAFCPARCLRPWTNRKMPNTTIFIDPDDVVPKLAFITFKHPKCARIELKKDVIGLSIKEHFMSHINRYIEENL